MNRNLFLSVTAIFTLTASAAESYMKGKSFACCDYSDNKVCIVDAEGGISWKQEAPHSNDLWLLPGKRILFSTGHGVKEMNWETGKNLLEYNSQSEIYAVQRLSDGNTFVGECNSGKLLTLNGNGEIIRSVNILPEGKDGGHAYYRNARVLKNGNYLVAHYGPRNVTEYDSKGKVVWQVKTPGGPHSTCRLANGNTLVACGDNGTPSLVEYNPEGQIVWQISNADLEGAPLKFLTGFQVLPNGNYLISNWVGHGKFGTAPHLLEITRDKKIVWTYNDHKAFKTISSVQVFNQDGTPVDGENLH